MKCRKRIFAVLASVFGFALIAYVCLVAYLFMNRPADGTVVDGDLMVQTVYVHDDANQYVRYLAMTNVINSSDLAAVLDALHKVSTCPYYQGPTNSILPFWRFNEIALTIGDAIDVLRKERKFHELILGVQDFYAFAKCCRDNSSSLVELSAGVGLCNKINMKVVRLAVDENVPVPILKELGDTIFNEPDYDALFRRSLKCEYSYWVKPGVIRLSQCADREGLRTKVETSISSNGICVVAPIVARLLVNTPGYAQFSYNGDATLMCAASVFREAQFSADIGGVASTQIDLLEPNWFGRQQVSSVCCEAIKFARRTLKSNVMAVRFSRIVVASQLYVRKHNGQFPATLAILVPEFLEAVPNDPFDDVHEIKYDSVEKIIWSVGENRKHVTPPCASSKKLMQDFCRWAMRIDGRPLTCSTSGVLDEIRQN